MIVAVISDTHLPRGNRVLPARCVELLGASDLILHAGDFVAEDVLDSLEALGPPVRAVHGNVDSAALRSRLPTETSVSVEGATIAIVHDGGPASRRLTRLRARFPDADAVVFGHSHLPLHEQAEGFQIFNPGSPTDRRRAPRHTMGIARARPGSLSFELIALD